MPNYQIQISNDPVRIKESKEMTKTALKYAFEKIVSPPNKYGPNPYEPQVQIEPDSLKYILHGLIFDNDPLTLSGNVFRFLLRREENILNGSMSSNDLFIDAKIRHFHLNVTIDANKTLKYDIELHYMNEIYSGNGKIGEIPGIYPPYISIEAKVLCKKDNSEHTLKIMLVSIIIDTFSEAALNSNIEYLLEEKSNQNGGKPAIFYTDSYTAGWRKMLWNCVYLRPDSHSSVSVEDSLSVDDVEYVLKYITQSRVGLLAFSYGIFSINRILFEHRNYESFILNMKYTQINENVMKHLLSIFHAFWKPDISNSSRGISNFSINRRFNINKCMKTIKNLRKYQNKFKYFPIFLVYAAQKEDPLGNPTQKHRNIKLSTENLEHLLDSHISFVTLNAHNDDERILQYDCECETDLDSRITINDAKIYYTKRLIDEYILFAEQDLNRTVYITSKDKNKLSEVHNEIYNEFAYDLFQQFIKSLYFEATHSVTINSSQATIDAFVDFCRLIDYANLLKLYKYNEYRTAHENNDDDKIKELFAKFIANISTLTYNDNKEDEKIKEDIDLYKYLLSLEEEGEYDDDMFNFFGQKEKPDPNLLQEKLNVCKEKLKNKFLDYRDKYRHSLILRCAKVADYNFPIDYYNMKKAENDLSKDKSTYCKDVQKYYRYILASMYRFIKFLEVKCHIPEETLSDMTKKLTDMSDFLSITNKPKHINNNELLLKLFCEFLSECQPGTELFDARDGKYLELFAPGNDETKNSIGWIKSDDKNTIKPIKKKNPLDAPLFIEFDKYLKGKNYSYSMNWKTFVDDYLHTNGIAMGSPTTKNRFRYNFKLTINEIQHSIYIMYLDKAVEYKKKHRS